MLNFLCFETCSPNPSVSIFINNRHLDTHILEGRTTSDFPNDTNQILVKNNIDLSHLDFVAATIGPGSFTGIRVGLSLAQGLCYSLKIPIVPVNSLDVLCSNSIVNENSIVALHSHGDFIFTRYKGQSNSHLTNVDEIKEKQVFGVGLGKFKHMFKTTELKYSSIEVGDYSIKNYDFIVTNNVGSISPIYLNEYKVQTSI